MSEGKGAAFDEIADMPLHEVTVDRFLEALESAQIPADVLAVWSSVRRMELGQSFAGAQSMTVRELLDKLQAERARLGPARPQDAERASRIDEKKKVELEVWPPARWPTPSDWPSPLPNEKKKVEMEPGPLDLGRMLSEPSLEPILAELEERIVKRLRSRSE